MKKRSQVEITIQKKQILSSPTGSRTQTGVVPRMDILQTKAGHLMVFTQCSVLNGDSPDVEENKRPFVGQRTKLHLGRKHPFWGFITDFHYLGLSTDLKMVSSQLLL